MFLNFRQDISSTYKGNAFKMRRETVNQEEIRIKDPIGSKQLMCEHLL